jgi:Arm DNA-binding domain
MAMGKFLSARRKPTVPPPKAARPEFSAGLFKGLQRDLEKQKGTIDRVTVSDDVVTGLQCIIRRTGLCSFHVGYNFGGSRPVLKLGNFPDMSVGEARELARTVRALAEMGIDVQEGLHERLIRELQARGTDWRP